MIIDLNKLEEKGFRVEVQSTMGRLPQIEIFHDGKNQIDLMPIIEAAGVKIFAESIYETFQKFQIYAALLD